MRQQVLVLHLSMSALDCDMERWSRYDGIGGPVR
jgi:hypothetical protein